MPSKKRPKIVVAIVMCGVVLAIAYFKTRVAPSSRQSHNNYVQAASAEIGHMSGPITLRRLHENKMARAFEAGQLPQPLPQPVGDIDLVAIQLAKKVRANDEESVAALLTALQMSGISVRGHDGSIIVQGNKPGQGMAMPDWQVAALAQQSGEGMLMNLYDFEQAFTSTVIAWKDVPLGKLIVQGLARDAASSNPALRFWARFINELGRQQGRSCDLLNPQCDSKKVTFDPIQLALVLQHIAGDLEALHPTAKPNSRLELQRQNNSAPKLLPASFHPFPSHVMPAAFIQEASAPPCNMNETEGYVTDASALGISQAFEALTSYLGESAEAVGKATGVINVLLSYITCIATYAALETDIKMDGSPLIRNKSVVAGEQRTLTAHLSENTGKWQSINCLRPAFNVMGLDMTMAGNGPVAKAELHWVGMESFPWVVDFPSNAVRIQEQGTYAGAEGVAPGIAVKDFTSPTTDEQGNGSINIEGAPRNNAIIGKAMPWDREAKVLVTIALKAPDLQRDLKDLGLTTSGGLQGLAKGSVGLMSFWTILPELLYRAKWYSSNPYTVPVRDWEACDGHWYGSVTRTVKTTLSKNSSTDVGGIHTDNLMDKERTEVDSWDFEGNTEMGNIAFGELTQTVSGASVMAQKRSWVEKELGFNNFWSKNGAAAKCEIPVSNIAETREKLSGSVKRKSPLFLNVAGNSGNIALAAGAYEEPGKISIEGTQISSGTTRKPGSCTTETTNHSTSLSNSEEFRSPDVTLPFTFDPSDPNVADYIINPGEVIKAPLTFKNSTTESHTLPGGEHEEITLQWNLKRCVQ